ncbi:hypothetical protein ALC60_12207 [Trachymyrmex zeteki]|uniref:Neuropeptide Y n=1 Tax=Mycetomoellerius zeteki TaxID=64791 RepID=A0A151WLD8_9HYME|nr:PREDICTED: uncharacterized protein LOC108728771 [Trachymyrmex zeteki]XP_018313024.1 PREDICTED: uncharacterized protein LOC108728771 [Trachymyrmex zeteki]XP_018313025.1 PREDICTED: uncharacterized protein LOC108728771 [Trachymyrmex zeteki]XP_018313026.1 PREDICTED: uncharacterized protein LOC108728771 [Trachymyrmex zeteki]KYQ48702.1 hypothetical protein ALC60_12207 [Trachymyrmex zeteki]
MRTRMNPIRFFCCLLVTIIGITITCAEPEPMTRLTRPPQIINSNVQLQRYADLVKNFYHMYGKSRHGKRSDAAPLMELNATWETLKMIQDAQRQNEQQRQENIRQNKEQILLRNFPNSDADEYTLYDVTRSGSLSDIIGKYYNDVQ